MRWQDAPVSAGLYIINCSSTRYHVVRSAAASKGWIIEEEDRAEPVPTSFHGVDLAARTIRTAAKDAKPILVSRKAGYDPRTSPQVLWVDRSVVPGRVRALLLHQRLNHFAGMDCIARKALLFTRLMRIRRACVDGDGRREAAATVPSRVRRIITAATGESVDPRTAKARAALRAAMDFFYPRSFSSLTGVSALLRYMAEEASAADYFIVKPNKGCQGRGIRLTRDPVQVLRPAETTQREAECLIQCYVDRPLLMEGKKFDLRLYVLLTSVSEAPHTARHLSSPCGDAGGDTLAPELRGVHLYIHEEGLVRMCAAPYEAPNDENCAHSSAHLTNYAVNKKDKNYVAASHQLDEEEELEGLPCADARDSAEHGAASSLDELGNKRDLGFMRAFLNALPAPTPREGAERWQSVKRRVDECVVLTVLSGVSSLRREATGARAHPRSCFELLGFDIMLHADTLAPVLMEVNHSPSLFCDTELDFRVKQRVLRDTLTMVETYTPPWDDIPQANSHNRNTMGCQRAVQPPPVGSSEEPLAQHRQAGFSQLLPYYIPHDARGSYASPRAESEQFGDWTEVERSRQVEMVKLGTAAL